MATSSTTIQIKDAFFTPLACLVNMVNIYAKMDCSNGGSVIDPDLQQFVSDGVDDSTSMFWKVIGIAGINTTTPANTHINFPSIVSENEIVMEVRDDKSDELVATITLVPVPVL